ncbi:MAG TPA: hypothetical protein VFQ41_22820 [Candidatus Angelobacter sp.]|nr:hypothetical protein [Candidatus Angelobacter sp.]
MADKLKSMLKTVTDAALFIEQILGEIDAQAGTASGPGGFDPAAAERVTEAFANLASIAIQAVHDAAGREITPESVQALMPVGTPLAPPVGG